jgi:hypothetical protein
LVRDPGDDSWPRIDVIDTEHDKLLEPIPLSTAGNGVVAIRGLGDDNEEDGAGTLVVGGLIAPRSSSIWPTLEPRLLRYTQAE